METERSVGDGKRLSNEELGELFRRFEEILRRVANGGLDKAAALKGLQAVSEGRVLPEIRYASRAQPPRMPFTLPDEKARQKSFGGWDRRLPLSRKRLDFPERNPERIIAELWEAENISDSANGRVPMHVILDEREGSGTEMFYTFQGPPQMSERDTKVVNSTIQWLGTHVGQSFLRKFLAESQILVS